ncbi:MAG: hypothetical protein KGV51_06775 [Moraxellaceae bacterium]|nr:hypothetical protein [Moraxellaceae bacterium]
MNKEVIKMENEFDFSTAKRPHEVPAIQQLRQAQQREQLNTKALDDDVENWVIKQDNATKEYINNMIRTFMHSKLAI